MANPVVFVWPEASNTAICLGQQTIGAADFLMNGELANTTGTNNSGATYFPNSILPYVSFGTISRRVTITCADDISGVTFTIIGTYRNAVQTENIAGPNATTVTTTAVFDTVTSVTSDGAVGFDTSVGTGTTGYTWWFNSNYYASTIGLSIQVSVDATINYSFETTLDDVQTGEPNNVFTPIAALTGATTDQLGTLSTPTRYSRIIVNSATDGSLTATFLQQGIT